MIIRRHLYSQNNLEMKNGMEFKPIYKKAPEPNSTSDGTTIGRDVEDLLRPIQRPKYNEETNGQQSQSAKERTERNLWRNDEVMEMLYTMQQVKALEKLNDKTVKSENVFKDVEVIMHRNGFVKKSHVQIWTKWKFLKSTYMTSRRNGVIPRIVPPQIYETIHQMITGLNQSLADSCSSVDGDSSSASGMVISGVEGGVSDVGVTNGDDEDSFGMAHPIFGFRLGMVKSEPEDTGYEPADKNGSDKDPLEEELSPSKTDKEVKEESNNAEVKSSKEKLPIQRVLEIPHRGRGRPPKYPPAATSTPNNTSSSAAKPVQMPPLRVAPFAKAIRSENNTTVNRPPPPLTMPPTTRIQLANLSSLKNGDPARFAQPKLIPKPIHQQHSPPIQSARIAKEQIAQTRSSSTPSPSYPKMKQIPMRKTPYSLRPDRAIPDLEASLSPPPPAIEKLLSKKLEEVPTTKHLIMQNNSINSHNSASRKRRSDWQDLVHNKQQRYNSIIDEERNNSKSDDDSDKNYGKLLQNVIIDLSSSLRKMQTEMMRDFFNKQNELLEKEHKFQIQQDHMIMKAFQEQTQDIMHSVKQLVGSIRSYKTCQQNNGAENIKVAKRNRNGRMQQMHVHRREVEVEDDQMENNDDNENEIEDEEQVQDQEQDEEDQEMEPDAEDIYTDGEEQQDQIEAQERDESHPEEMENIVDEEETEHNEQSQLTDGQNESDLTAEGKKQNPLCTSGIQ